MANVDEFPDCCGLFIINRFRGGHPGADPNSCMTETAVNKFLSGTEKEHYGTRAGLVAVLSEPQNDRIGKVFLSRKWKLLLDGTSNPRSGVKLYVYFRDLNPSKQREKRIFDDA